MDLFTLRATLGLDASEYEQKMGDVLARAKKDGKTLADTLGGGVDAPVEKAQKSLSGFGSTLASILTSNAIQGGVRAIAGFTKESMQAASSLAEVQNVIDTTFGSASGSIDQWATGQAWRYGLTEAQAKKFAAEYGGLFVNDYSPQESAEMSMRLAELAGDLASFRNLELEDAQRAILSGMAGQTEALVKYGLAPYVGAIEESLGVDYEKLTQGEKAKARYDYLTGQSSYFKGDFWNTRDEYANSARTFQNNVDRIKASMGQQFLPIAQSGVNAANGFFEAFWSETPEETLGNIDIAAENAAAEIEKGATSARAAIGVLEDFGDKTALSTQEQKQWNEVARRLIGTFPELADSINMQTGEIEGGTQALYDSVDAWEQVGKAAAEDSALNQKREMLSGISDEIAAEQAQIAIAEKQLEQAQDSVIALGTTVAESLGKEFDGTAQGAKDLISTNAGWYEALKTGLSEAELLGMFAPIAEAEAAIEEHTAKIAQLQTDYSTVSADVETSMGSMSGAVAMAEGEISSAFSGIEGATDSAVMNFDQSANSYSYGFATGIGAADGLSDALPYYNSVASQYGLNPVGGEQPQGFATGLDYVPFNDMPALLHEGEAVLTKAEADAWRSGGAAVIDYNAMGTAVGQGVREALQGIGLYTDDGTRIADLVTERVSRNIARGAKSGRFSPA